MTTHYLQRPDGRIAYDDEGSGPLVVCVPGMGDLRAEYRFLRAKLLASGHRVVTMDLRGHGESAASFSDYERPSAGDDVVALLAALDAGPAHLIGASYGAAAAVWAAAEAPAEVATVTLIGPFVRDLPVRPVERVGMRILLARPWGRRVWLWWFTRLHVAGVPEDFADYRANLRANLGEPGRMDALRAMGKAGCAEIDPRLDALSAPVLVVMGSMDPDFSDPRAEAAAIAERTGGEVAVIACAGHYPHVEEIEETGAAITDFLARHRAAT